MAADRSVSDSPVAGISLCVIALFLFSLQDVVIKGFSGSYSLLQLVLIRAWVALTVIATIIACTGGWRSLAAYRPGLSLLRGALGFSSYLCYYMAMAVLPLAQVVTIAFAAPLFVTALSVLVLRESVGWARWSAVLIGFLAIVIVIGPSGDFHDLGALLAVLAAVTYACSTMITRLIGPSDQPATITLYAMLSFLAGSVIASALVLVLGAGLQTDDPALQFLFRAWRVPSLGGAPTT